MEKLFNKIFLPLASSVARMDRTSQGVMVITENGCMYDFTSDEVEIVFTWFFNSHVDTLRNFVQQLKQTLKTRAL